MSRTKVVQLPTEKSSLDVARTLVLEEGHSGNASAKLTAIRVAGSNATRTYDIEEIREVLAEYDKWQLELNPQKPEDIVSRLQRRLLDLTLDYIRPRKVFVNPATLYEISEWFDRKTSFRIVVPDGGAGESIQPSSEHRQVRKILSHATGKYVAIEERDWVMPGQFVFADFEIHERLK